jgi:fumarate reductase subunit C
VTWFNLAPKAMAIRLGGKRLPNLAIAGPNYIAWAVISAAVAWILLRG